MTDLIESVKKSFVYLSCLLHRKMFIKMVSINENSVLSSFSRFLDHTQRRATVGRTPLDE